MEVGSRVVRGPDWKWGNQDGGEGHVGTVVVVGRSGSTASPDKTVVVQWDGGTRTNYRCGYQSAYDICLLDNGPCGVQHANMICNECKKKGIEGMTWQCTDCDNYNLCSTCYMGEKHQVEHGFCRIEAPGKPGVLVGRRAGKRKVQAKGIFIGARVKRGPDWDWGNQDGGSSSIGQVTDVRGWEMESSRSVVSVTWQSAGTNVYRVGHKGKVDIVAVSDGLGALYYKDHLPRLGQSPESLVIPSSSVAPPLSSQFHAGDKVRVLLGLDVLNVMQEGHGGWNAKMEEVIGLVGTVHRITEHGDIRVQYPGFANRWTFHPAALTKVVNFNAEDRVQIISDKDVVKRLQVGHGEWADEMKLALGKTGKVLKVYSDGDLRVAVGGRTWTFNPAVLTQEQILGTTMSSAGTSQQPPVSETTTDSGLLSLISTCNLKCEGKTDIGARIVSEAGQGHMEVVKELLDLHPDKVNVRISGKTALQFASHQGHVETIKVLLNCGSNTQMKDNEGDTALHYASFGNKCKAATVLLESGVDPNVANKNKCTPLHVAVSKGYVDVVRALLKFKSNANSQDTYGDTALHDAVTKDYGEVMELLVNAQNADLTLCNRRGFNVLQHAALKGHTMAATKILLKCPQIINIKKSDGFAALHLSAFNGHYDVCRVLVEADNCDVNVRNSRLETPLQLAVDKRYVSIVELLLCYGAQVNAVDGTGDTALHVAVAYHSLLRAEGSAESAETTEGDSSFAIVKALMHHGADSSIKNKQGRTPLQICRDGRLKFLLQFTDSNTSGSSLQNESMSNTSESETEGSGRPAAVEANCRLCDFPADAKFEPCGHVVSCSECAHLFKKCYVCKGSVVSVVKVDESPEYECVVCSDRVPEVTFEPCSHRIVCKDCAVRMKKCVKCQVKITRKISTEGDLSSCQSSLNENDEKYLDTLHSLTSLKAKVREIEDETTCSICLENKRNIAFLCGHGTCADCAASLQVCPMCRKLIEQKIQLFN